MVVIVVVVLRFTIVVVSFVITQLDRNALFSLPHMPHTTNQASIRHSYIHMYVYTYILMYIKTYTYRYVNKLLLNAFSYVFAAHPPPILSNIRIQVTCLLCAHTHTQSQVSALNMLLVAHIYSPSGTCFAAPAYNSDCREFYSHEY